MDQQQLHVDSAAKQNGIKLQLVPATKTEGSNGHVIANLVVVSEGTNGDATSDTEGMLPYIDDAVTAVNVKSLQSAPAKEEKPRVRYYAVGPSTYRIKCPLCHQQANACVMRGAGIKDATCCLSLLSCFFPIFWLCFLFTWCGCNSQWHTNGLYCNKCGGKLGKLRKPK